MNRYYGDPFSMLVGHQYAQPQRQQYAQPQYNPYTRQRQVQVGNMPYGRPMYVGQAAPGAMVPGGGLGLPIPGLPAGDPGLVGGPFGPCGGPAPMLAPMAAVASVSPCAVPISVSSDTDGALPLEPGEERTLTVPTDAWGCITKITVPRIIGFAFEITSIKAGQCDVLSNGPIHGDVLAPDSNVPCIQTFQLCPWLDLKVTVRNVSVEDTPAAHFRATFWARFTPQSCLPCDSFA